MAKTGMWSAGIDIAGHQAGLTLLEMLVVLMLLALAYALAVPFAGTEATGADMRAATRQLAAGLRKARVMAISEKRETVFTVDVDTRAFRITGESRPHSLPRQLDITLVTAQSELAGSQVGSIRFFPDGTSTGGQLAVFRPGARNTIDVDWITGRVTVGHD